MRPFNLLCVLGLFSERWQSTLFQIFFFFFWGGGWGVGGGCGKVTSLQSGQLTQYSKYSGEKLLRLVFLFPPSKQLCLCLDWLVETRCAVRAQLALKYNMTTRRKKETKMTDTYFMHRLLKCNGAGLLCYCCGCFSFCLSFFFIYFHLKLSLGISCS